MRSDFVFQEKQQKHFQWNKGDKIKNRIRFLANFKAHMEYKNNDFNAARVKQYEAFREAMNSASLKISSLSIYANTSG